MSKERFLLPYLPDAAWLKAFLLSDEPVIDLHAHFVKQTPRNRTYILGPNGIQSLIVPIQGRNKRQAFGDVKVSYADKWQRVHLQAIRTAYGAAPFFDYVFPEIERIYEQSPEYLYELNALFLKSYLRLLKADRVLVYSVDYELSSDEIDRRSSFIQRDMSEQSYPQVFQEKWGFQSGLSALDRMMNELTRFREEV